MKRLLSVCLLLLCLCFPVCAGHNIAGGYCECGAPGCICEPGETSLGSRASVPNESSQETPSDSGSETLLVLAVLLLMLRYKA
jgi:hypothetical protein